MNRQRRALDVAVVVDAGRSANRPTRFAPPFRDQFGADNGDLARGVDSEADLAPLKSNDRNANVVADVQFFHELSRQHQHGASSSH